MCFNCLIMGTNTLCDKKDVCGSCGWSEISYEEQLNKKLHAINQSAKSANTSIVCSRIIPAVKTSNYRNRMDFVIDYKGNFGLRERGKWWKVIDNHTCFLPDAAIITLYHKIYGWVKACGLSYYDRKADKGLLRYVVIRATKLGETMVIVLTTGPKNSGETDLIQSKLADLSTSLNAASNVTSSVWSYTVSKSDISFGETYEVISGRDYIREKINDHFFIIRPNSFFQTNSYTAELLQAQVMSIINRFNLPKTANILDLYCGSGFFTLPLSQRYNAVFGVESVQDAINDAKENARVNNSNANFICDVAENIKIADYSPEFVLVDPPRAGLHPKVINDILTAQPKYLLYVSCKYEKFLSEMSALGAKYSVVNCCAVDMFPHTPHVELITALERRP